MAFLGLEVGKSEPGYRLKRFAAFLLDTAIVLTIVYIVFRFTGKPDFPAVKAAMDTAREGAGSPNAQALANEMFTLFNAAYWQTLMIWFLYEVVSQFAFFGATPGKLILGLRITSMNPNRKWPLHYLLMAVRSAIKVASLYIFQGFPFLIAVLSIFANKEARAGYDIFAKTYVKNIRGEKLRENIYQFPVNE